MIQLLLLAALGGLLAGTFAWKAARRQSPGEIRFSPDGRQLAVVFAGGFSATSETGVVQFWAMDGAQPRMMFRTTEIQYSWHGNRDVTFVDGNTLARTEFFATRRRRRPCGGT